MRRAARITLIEGILVGAGLVVAAWFLTAKYYEAQVEHIKYFAEPALEELAPIESKYGPNRFSRNVEEWNIRDFFQDRRGGTFLDVGANHYRDENNTYYLESVLGWSGVAVEPIEEFSADYKTHRPRTQFVAAFASDKPGASVDLFVPNTPGRQLASSDPKFAESEGDRVKQRSVPTTTLNVVLEQAGVAKIDFMSMDIELSEPAALAGFDIDKYKPSLVCIEAHPEVRQQLIDYFDEHNYRLVGKYLRADVTNLYFAPADTFVRPGPIQ